MEPGTSGDGYHVESNFYLLILSFLTAAVGVISLFIYAKKTLSDVGIAQTQGGRPVRPPHHVRAAARLREARRFNDEDSDVEPPLDGAVDPHIESLAADMTEASFAKMGTKKLKKLEMKAERRAQRESEEVAREEKRRREETLEAQLKRQEKREREEVERKEAEEKEQERARREKEQEEYLELKQSFQVEEEGIGVMSQEEGRALMLEFINHIKTEKVVLLEELAAKFNLRTQDCIARVRDLQSQGQLTGVVDERGKFIHITPSEMEGVADFIRCRGRVSLSELAQSSSRIINLTPVSPSDVSPRDPLSTAETCETSSLRSLQVH